MKKKAFFIFLLSGVMSYVFAQNKKADSLAALLRPTKQDTNRVKLLREMGERSADSRLALSYFRQSVDLAHKLNYTPGLCLGYTRIYSLYFYTSVFDSALAYIDTTLYYTEKGGQTSRLAAIYLSRANVHLSLSNYRPALNDCLSAEKYARETGDKDALAHIFQLQSNIYRSQNQLIPAMEFQGKSIQLFRQLGNRPEEGHALYTQAMLLLRMHKSEEALQAINTAIAIADSTQKYATMATYRQVLTEILLEEKRYPEAEAVASKALKFAELSNIIQVKGYVLGVFSVLHEAQQNYPEAIRYGTQAYTIFKNAKDLWHQRKFAAILARASENTGSTEQALHYHKIFHALHDSLLRQELATETSQLQLQFRFREKDNEIKLLAQEKELQQQRLYKQTGVSLLTGTLALMLLGGIVLLRNRSRLKHQIRELQLRNVIASDLHDEVGSSLSSIHLLSQMIKSQPESPRRSELLEILSRNVKETVDRVMDIVWVVKPEENEKGCLRERMERFACDICRSADIEPELDIGEIQKGTLTMVQRKNLYLIFKEAVNNAVKYSGAGKLSVTLAQTGKELLLKVEDQGRGFNPATIEPGNGLGNMKNRAKELNATLEISSREGAGTTVWLNMPVNS